MPSLIKLEFFASLIIITQQHSSSAILLCIIMIDGAGCVAGYVHYLLVCNY
jgi:hypothetical protein